MNFKKIFQKKANLSELPVQHDWEMISRSYSAPRKDITALTSLNLTDDTKLKALTGVTTYLWQCKNTGELRKEEMLGCDKDELEELAEKVEKGGMQYIRMNGNIYAIAKWAPPKEGEQIATR